MEHVNRLNWLWKLLNTMWHQGLKKKKTEYRLRNTIGLLGLLEYICSTQFLLKVESKISACSRQIFLWQIMMIYQITFLVLRVISSLLGIKSVQWFFSPCPVPVSKLLKLKRFLNNCHKCCLKEPAEIKLIIKDYDWLTWEYWSVWRWSPQSQHTPSPSAPLSWRWPAPCMCVACIWPGTWNSKIIT